MTRDEILNAAAHVFSEKGFEAASMQDIAEAVSLQKASLYHHFSGKQEILVALLDRALDLLVERIEPVVAQPASPEEKLRRAMASYLQALADYRDLSSVLLFEHRSLSPELRALHVPRRDRFERLWRDLIQEGKQAGVFNCTDAGLATRALMGLANWVITWYRPDGPLSVEEIAAELSNLLLHGLLARS